MLVERGCRRRLRAGRARRAGRRTRRSRRRPRSNDRPCEQRVRQHIGRPDVVEVGEREDEQQQPAHLPPRDADALVHASSATTYERTERAPAARSAPLAAASVAPVVATSSTSATRAPRSAPASATYAPRRFSARAARSSVICGHGGADPPQRDPERQRRCARRRRPRAARPGRSHVTRARSVVQHRGHDDVERRRRSRDRSRRTRRRARRARSRARARRRT